MGWALEDRVVVGGLADRMREVGRGQTVEIEAIQEDPANPYEGMWQLTVMPLLARDG